LNCGANMLIKKTSRAAGLFYQHVCAAVQLPRELF